MFCVKVKTFTNTIVSCNHRHNDKTTNKMQTLFIPDKIQIDFLDTNNNPLRQDKILIGIRTFANHKNNISLSPFLTDNLGSLTITIADIKDCFDNFVSYGLMDYSSLETAKPGIEIFFWGNKSLDRYIDYWTKLLHGKKDLKQFEMWGDKLGKLQKEFAKIEQKEREKLQIYETCFNKTTKLSDDLILVKDNWDKPNSELKYKVKLDTK